ncbi:TlpA family protein disulfide reductase [Georgenia wangjunii]|uniref:TlpA family protein disulfide reductase n=1 Tax=Georgenia wangjunii TaxID=3117730 RepID=UPI002F2605D7
MSGRPAGAPEPLAAPDVLTAADLLPAETPLGERATLVQLSTTFCAPCRSARTVLARAAATSHGVVHVDVDVTGHEALAERLALTETPTILVLDAAGHVVERRTGVPRLAQVRAVLETLGA